MTFRALLLGVLGGLFAAALVFLCAGCHDGSHSFSPDPGNLYLKNCRVEIDENGSQLLLADVELPHGYIGLLYASDNVFSETVVFESGTVQINALPVDASGIYEYCLKFVREFINFEVDKRRIEDLTDVVECCIFELGEEPIEPLPDDDPIEEPKLICNVNFDGHLSIVISLGTFASALLECDSLYSGAVLVSLDQTIVETEVIPGEYVFRLVLEDVVLTCTVNIPEAHEPNGPKKRFWSCFKGNSLYLPEPAYLRHLELGAVPGPCN
jgi:hypothetical protein